MNKRRTRRYLAALREIGISVTRIEDAPDITFLRGRGAFRGFQQRSLAEHLDRARTRAKTARSSRTASPAACTSTCCRCCSWSRPSRPCCSRSAPSSTASPGARSARSSALRRCSGCSRSPRRRSCASPPRGTRCACASRVCATTCASPSRTACECCNRRRARCAPRPAPSRREVRPSACAPHRRPATPSRSRSSTASCSSSASCRTPSCSARTRVAARARAPRRHRGVLTEHARARVDARGPHGDSAGALGDRPGAARRRRRVLAVRADLIRQASADSPSRRPRGITT